MEFHSILIEVTCAQAPLPANSVHRLVCLRQVFLWLVPELPRASIIFVQSHPHNAQPAAFQGHKKKLSLSPQPKNTCIIQKPAWQGGMVDDEYDSVHNCTNIRVPRDHSHPITERSQALIPLLHNLCKLCTALLTSRKSSAVHARLSRSLHLASFSLHKLDAKTILNYASLTVNSSPFLLEDDDIGVVIRLQVVLRVAVNRRDRK